MLTTTAFWYLLLTLTHFWQETWEFLKEKKSAYIQIGFREKFRVYKLMKFSKTTLFSKKSNARKSREFEAFVWYYRYLKELRRGRFEFLWERICLAGQSNYYFLFFSFNPNPKVWQFWHYLSGDCFIATRNVLHVWSTTNGSIFLFEF